MCRFDRAVRSVVESLEGRWLLAAGDLDPSFGLGGKYLDPHELVPTDVAVQADGKILISGYGLFDVGSVLRLNANGTPDASFGSGGYASSGFGPYTSYANAVAAGPGGRVAVAGFAGPYREEIPRQATLVVYDSAGKVDKSFDGDGIVNAPQFARGFADVAFQADGKILALGEKLVRYNANGTLDKTFDGDGVVDVSGKKIAIDASGRITVLGYFAVFRFTPGGAKDAGLDGDGVLPNVKGADLAIAPDGDLLVAASGPYGDSVSRFTSAGAPKAGWGGGGVLRAFGRTLAVNADNVFVGGTLPALVIPHDQFEITALTHGGKYDANFGQGGKQTVDFGMDNDRTVGIALQGGKLVAVGSSEQIVNDPPGYKVTKPAAARLLLGGATPPGQSPFGGTPIAIPGGDIRAADFDRGGEGVAYHDTDAANAGGFNYRPGEGVDVQNKAAGGPYVGFAKAGEWLEYTISVAASGLYDVFVGTAHQGSGGTFHLELDGQRLTNNLTAWHGRDWEDFASVGQNGVFLPAGHHVLRLAMDTNGSYGYVGNFLNIAIRSHVGPPRSPFLGRPFNAGERIEAENFDVGGEGVAYHDTDPQNVGGAYRPGDGVDIEPTADAGGGFNVGFLKAGEWLEYTLNFAQSGDYDLLFRYAKLKPGGSFRILVSGVEITGDFGQSTGSWQTYATRTIGGVPIFAGQQTLRFEVVSADPTGYALNLNWFQFNQV